MSGPLSQEARAMSPKYAMPARGKRVAQEVWAGKIMQRVQNANYRAKRSFLQKTENVTLTGGGAGVYPQDRSAGHTAKQVTSNPIDYPNYFERWREYVRWYRKSWEVRKVVDIIVDDAFRIPFELRGVDEVKAKVLMSYWNDFAAEKQFKRCWRQERLLGGSGMYAGVQDSLAYGDPDDRKTVSDPMWLEMLSGRKKEAFRCLNLIDVNRISRGDVSYNVFSEDYDKLKGYLIDGTFCDMSRLLIFDAEPLFNRQNLTLLQNWVLNPAGFGDSILGPLFDLLTWETGSQEAAFHLIGLASVLMATVSDYKDIASTKGGNAALEKLSKIMESISIYRALIIDGQDATISQHSANFGSVPDLMMSFLEILCAASDTPITRFLGRQSKGMDGGNEGDLENYYNTVDAAQRGKLKPNMMKLFSIWGVCEFGLDVWLTIKPGFDIFYPACFQKDDKEQAEIAKTWIEAMKPLYDAGMMDVQELNAELQARGIFLTPVELEDAIEEQPVGPDGLPLDPSGQAALGGSGEQQPPGSQPDAAGTKASGTSGRKPSGKTTVMNADYAKSEISLSILSIKTDMSEKFPEMTKDAESHGCKVFFVNGGEVKTNYEMDFCEGGNDLAYPEFIPKGEIWVDANLDRSQWPHVIEHELHERELMAGGLDYETAHSRANEVEKAQRKEADGAAPK
jgi:phage-related protein (TIGR01555 family)